MSKKLQAMLKDKPAPRAEEPKLTESELKLKVEAEMEARRQACLAEVREVMKKHDCHIDAMPVIEAGMVSAVWGVRCNE